MRLWLKSLRKLSIFLFLYGCVERFYVGEEGGVTPGKGGGTWVLTTLSPELWYIDDSARRVIFADLWANSILKVGDTIFIANSGTNTVFKYIIPNSEIETLRVGDGRNPYSLAYSHLNNTLFVSNFLTSTISAFKGKNLISEFETCGNPEGLYVAGRKLFVSCTNYYFDMRGELWIHDVFTFDTIKTFRTGINAQSVILDGDGDIYVLSTGDYSGRETYLYRITENIDSFFIGGYLGKMCISKSGYLFLVGWYGGVYRFDWAEERGDGFIISDISASSCSVKGDTLIISDFDNDRILYTDFSGRRIKIFYVGDGPIDVYAEEF